MALAAAAFDGAEVAYGEEGIGGLGDRVIGEWGDLGMMMILMMIFDNLWRFSAIFCDLRESSAGFWDLQ